MKKPISNNLRGGLVTAPILYLKNVKNIDETSLEKVKSVVIDSVGQALCEHFDNHSNCTLTGAYNLLSFYRDAEGLAGIPTQAESLYGTIRKVGDRYGYNYEREKGIPVYNNRRFLKAVLKDLGCSDRKVVAEYMVPAGRAIRLLDAGTPFMLSIAYGIYFNHTITVYGYETYMDKTTGRTYTFLIINDEWAGQRRYLPWTRLARFRITCLTRIV